MPYYIRGPKTDHNFDNQPYGCYRGSPTGAFKVPIRGLGFVKVVLQVIIGASKVRPRALLARAVVP